MTSTLSPIDIASHPIPPSHEVSYRRMDEYEAYEHGFVLHNKYKFLKLIQTGSFGKVTLALDESTNTKCAIKSMYKNQNAMFRHEINIMDKLGAHPNLVRLIEFFNTENYHILVLEYCDDGDLYDKIVELSDKPMISSHLVNQLLTVVSYMHSKKVYHRDLKPENILLMQNGDLKLCDFGLSTLARYPFETNIGTEKYMSPESINVKNYDSKFADYWSLGITICFLVFGKCPFQKASLTDNNYNNFVNNREWLAMYYNNMSYKFFRSILNLLSPVPEERNLEKFQLEFQDACITGLTLQQEIELASCNSCPLEDYVFEMEGGAFDHSLYMDIEDDDEAMPMPQQELPTQQQIAISSVVNSIPVPSLINSHLNSFSWADDEFEFESRLNLHSEEEHLQNIDDSLWFQNK